MGKVKEYYLETENISKFLGELPTQMCECGHQTLFRTCNDCLAAEETQDTDLDIKLES